MHKTYIYKGKMTHYLIYDDGRVFNTLRQRFMKIGCDRNGYLYLNLSCGEDRPVRKGIHQMVAETFIPNPENKPTVNHKDGNKLNNHVDNLEWATYSEQMHHVYALGLRKPNPPEKVVFTKYSPEQVEKACQMISDGEFLSVIEEATQIPVKTLGEIRSGQIWKSISSKYDFSKKHYVSSTLYDPQFRRDVEALIREGRALPEIYDIFNIDLHDQKTKDLIRYWSYRMRKSSTTIEKNQNDSE